MRRRGAHAEKKMNQSAANDSPLLIIHLRNGSGSSVVRQSLSSLLGARDRNNRRGISHLRARCSVNDPWGMINPEADLESASRREQSRSRMGGVQSGYRRAFERTSAACDGSVVFVHEARRYCTRKDMGDPLNISKKWRER